VKRFKQKMEFDDSITLGDERRNEVDHYRGESYDKPGNGKGKKLGQRVRR
jgi:hypothetical protein